MKNTSTRSFAVALTISLLLILAIFYYWPIQEPYHPLNTDWNGCSQIASTRRSTALLFSYDEKLLSNSTLAIIGPSQPFSISDTSIIRQFLMANGTVLLADDYGSGNSLLQQLNLSVRFSGKPLADLYYYSKSPNFPITSDFYSSPLTANVTSVLLDHPSYLEINNTSQVTTLATTSPFSFIDVQGNGEPTQNESIRAYPLMAYTHFGSGIIIVISDSTIFINEIVGFYDNIRLFENVIGQNKLLVFDVGHLANAPLTNTRIILRNVFDGVSSLVRGSVYVQALLVVLVLIVTLPFELFNVIKRGGKLQSRFIPPAPVDSLNPRA